MIEIRSQQGFNFAIVTEGNIAEARGVIEDGSANALNFCARQSERDMELVEDILSGLPVLALISSVQGPKNTKRIIRLFCDSLQMISHDQKNLDLSGIGVPNLSRYSGPDLKSASIFVDSIRSLYLDPFGNNGVFEKGIEFAKRLRDLYIANGPSIDLAKISYEMLDVLDIFRVSEILNIEEALRSDRLKRFSIQKCPSMKFFSASVGKMKSIREFMICDVDQIDSLDFVTNLPSLEFLSFYRSKFLNFDLTPIIEHPNRPRIGGNLRGADRKQLEALADQLV